MILNLWILWKTQDSRLWNLWTTASRSLFAMECFAIVTPSSSLCITNPMRLEMTA